MLKSCEIKICEWESEVYPETPCGRPVEGRTNFCASHNKLQRDAEKRANKDAEKLALKLSKKREPRATPTRDPKKWKNTFLCSDGTRVTQAEIDAKLKEAYQVKYTISPWMTCEGCGEWADSSAHIIAKSRCKQLHKTELVWCPENFFPACYSCNSAIESPKGGKWKVLRNIDKCMEFVRIHDKELFQKFLNNGYQAKIKENEII
jgi:5-methylcytosine-specific restriction endonuclease McrA